MPNVDFFNRLGVFAIKEFLDLDLCHILQSAMCVSPSAGSAPVTAEGIESVDEAIRRTKLIRVSDDIINLIMDRLKAVKPQIEEHFQITLDDCENPQFLAYKKGDFFKLHTDRSTSSSAQKYAQQRRVSVVIFLNGKSSQSQEAIYTGGLLILYGLIQQKNWEKYGFNLQGEPGLLIAFASEVYHEVTPVTQGVRYTIVSWFPAKSN